MELHVRRPRIFRRVRLIRRSVGIGPLWVTRERRVISFGPFRYSDPRKRRSR